MGFERGNTLVGKVHNWDESVAGEESFMSEPKANVMFKSQQFDSQQKGKVYNVHLRAGSSKMKIFYANRKEELLLESISKLNVKIGGGNKWKFVG